MSHDLDFLNIITRQRTLFMNHLQKWTTRKVYHERKNPCIIARRDTRGIKISLDRDYTGKGRVQITIIPASPLKFDLKPPPPFSFLSLFTLEFHARGEITISLFHGSQFHPEKRY